MRNPRRPLTRLALVLVVAAACAVAVVGAAALAGGTGPGVSARWSSSSAEELSAQLAANDAAMRQAIDAWRAGGDPPTAPPPQELMASARHLQEAVRSLARHEKLAENTIALLPVELARDVRELVAAARELRALSAGWPNRRLDVGKPRPLAELMRYYDAGHRRHNVGQHYLAAVHLVESKFGRVKSHSVAGAQGPMQFMPSTWEIYGHGDIQDPHDAILAAANLLDDRGAPGSYRKALYAYNPSGLYVDAVQRYARLIKRDSYAVYFLYCWGP